MGTTVLLCAGVVLAIVGVTRIRREPRRLSTGFVLLGAVGALAAGVVLSLAAVIPLAVPGPAVRVVVALVPTVTALALVVNGVQVIRREGLAPITSTPLVVGAGLLVLVAAVVAADAGTRAPEWAMQLALVSGALGAYLVVHLIAFGGYALLYERLPERTEVDAVVVLGCGLNRGAVTPLLAARLDRGIRVYRAAVAAGGNPIVVTCGGRGPDETTSEADAMGRYLTARGIPGCVVVRERRSRNTEENLRNCLRELEARALPPGKLRMTVVTSNFHVLRTAALTRRLGVDAQVLGARTATYFLPAAFLREFVAVLTTHYRRSHAVVAAATAVALVTAAADAALTLR
ncbi:YdcF family protein [Nocardia sp. NPDC004068]|uniref:YdcF family protein n=1 Tax=Nocardia sp. NPDC004068 TaxID=3364303 RepID=UPI00367A1559